MDLCHAIKMHEDVTVVPELGSRRRVPTQCLKGRVVSAPERSPGRGQRVPPAKQSPGLPRAQLKVFHEIYTMVIHPNGNKSIKHQLEKRESHPEHVYGSVSLPKSVSARKPNIMPQSIRSVWYQHFGLTIQEWPLLEIKVLAENM